jgi:sporulation protein YlmC with PRC-barrel domain
VSSADQDYEVRNIAEKFGLTASLDASFGRIGEPFLVRQQSPMGVNDYYKQNVYDRSDNSIGEVSDLLLDKSGQVRAVMLSVGGFLGVGGKYVSVPFDALEVREKNGNRYLVMDTTKEALKSAPGYQYDRTAGKWVPEKG